MRGSAMDREEALQTRQQRFRARRWDRMFVSRAAITSAAFLSLRTAVACQAYLIFLNKCQWKKAEIRPGSRDKDWVLVNNGEIQFSYIEAWDKYRISAKRFTRAIDELVRVGLIDLAHSGFGLQKDLTLYAISDRWKKYGTDEFVRVERPKRDVTLGFAKGNRHGRNRRLEKKSTVADACCATVADNCCAPDGQTRRLDIAAGKGLGGHATTVAGNCVLRIFRPPSE
jgi:hypothetical protein